jgi:hypothetical protein
VNTVLGATGCEALQHGSQIDECLIKEGKKKNVRGLIDMKHIEMALSMLTINESNVEKLQTEKLHPNNECINHNNFMT